MRSHASALFLAGLLAGSLAAGLADAAPCVRPAEKAAFDVAGLKSQLMVTALTCQTQDKYNAFVTRFRSELQGQESTLNAYFRRSFGGRAQQEHDNYITALANAQSHEGIQSGTLFCPRNVGLFDDVLALKSGDLAPFAASKSPVQPVAVTQCPLDAAPSPHRSHKPKATRTAAK